MKYEQQINFDFANTMSIIVPLIKAGSTVLEFGPASGRLTKYLKEEKQCKMYIVEIDEEAGAVASQYAEEAIIGDILNYEWEEKFKDISFDYILFVDVLEHLTQSKDVLDKCKCLLKDTGKIIISIPNIAHNSVIIDLMKNKFEYQQTGLLDCTHVKFWSFESMKQMLSDIGLFIEARYATYTQVGLNEFDNSYEDVPEEVSLFLKTRENGELYQYVLLVTSEKTEETKDFFVDKRDYLYTQFFLDDGSGVKECEALKRSVVSKNCVNTFQISHLENNLKLRVDPLNRPCIARVTCRARADVQSEMEELQPESSNAVYYADNVYWFENDDPQIYYSVEHFLEVQVKLEICEFLVPGKTLKKLLDWKNISEQKEHFINEQRGIISEKDKLICEKNSSLEEKEKAICEKDKMISQKEEQIIQQKQSIEELEKEIAQQKECIERYGRFVEKGAARILYNMFLKKE